MGKNTTDRVLRDALWQAVVRARQSGMSEDDIALAVAGTLVRQKSDAYRNH